MPVLVIILFLIAGIIGGSTGSFSNSAPVDESDVVISSPTGGLLRPGAETTQTPISNQVSNTTNRLSQNTPTPRPTPTQPSPATPPPSTVLPALPPTVTTLAPQNLNTRQATLRGEITFPGQRYPGEGFFVYSTRASEVTSIGPGSDRILISSNLSTSGKYSKTVYQLTDDTTYYYRICFEDTVVRCGETLSFKTVEETYRYRQYRPPTISTYQPTDVNAESATLVARYQINDAENVQGFFIYGQSQSNVRAVATDYDYYSDVRERGDNLKKVNMGTRLDNSATISRVVNNLEKNSRYYYTFCIAYDDDEATDIACGYPLSFTTKSRQLDTPVISSIMETVTGADATFRARISMRDYNDGYVFVAYGNNRSSVEAVSNRSRYDQISQNNDALQKITIDNDFDGNDVVSVTVRDLTSGFQYYRFCVEYERENNYGYEVFVLECSELRNFSVE